MFCYERSDTFCYEKSDMFCYERSDMFCYERSDKFCYERSGMFSYERSDTFCRYEQPTIGTRGAQQSTYPVRNLDLTAISLGLPPIIHTACTMS